MWKKKNDSIFIRKMLVIHKSTQWGVIQWAVKRFILQV